MLTIYQKQARLKLATTVITLIVIAGGMLATDNLKSEPRITATKLNPAKISNSAPAASSATSRPAAVATGSVSGSSISGAYKDGTYTSRANYYVPAGNQSIEVAVTLNNGIITRASVQNSESDSTSAQFQQNFEGAYRSVVVGQKISSLKLGVIAGASETTQAFADALDRITSQAQA